MFNITANKGFHITFTNGWTASVQWGWQNYCDNYGLPKSYKHDDPAKPSKTAEVACWGPDKVMVNIWNNNGDTVIGHLSANEVVQFLNKVLEQ